MQERVLLVSSGQVSARSATFEGREFLVVPVVMLVEGVIHAANAPAAELVTQDEFTRAPQGWDGRPLYHGHPMRDGQSVSGNRRDILESERIGFILGTQIKNNKLTTEAWVDVERCASIAPRLLERIRAKEDIEISVGVFVDAEAATGTFNGQRYSGKWTGIVPDHLALLPEDQTGACSRQMGCGVRAAKGAEDVSIEFKTLRDIPMSERDKMAEEDFAGPNRSFPIGDPEDVSAAAHALGRAKGDRNAIKRRIISIAYRKGDDYVAQLPDDWKKKKDRTNASWFARLMSALRVSQTPDEMTESDLKRKLTEALREAEGQAMCYVETWYPVNDPTHVVYTCYDEHGEFNSYPCLYERSFDLSDAGVVTLSSSRIEVEPVMRYEPVEGAEPEMRGAAAPPCQCGGNKDDRSAKTGKW